MAMKGLPFIVLAVGDDLFGRYGSECRDELLIGTTPSTPLSSIPDKLYVASVDVKQRKRKEE